MGIAESGALNGRVAIITGAATGIGRASALLFAGAGARVALADARAPELARTVEDVRAAGGAIVNIASVSAFRGSVERPSHAYAASKGAVLSLTRAMAASYGRDRIRVNAICPGTIRTRLTADIVDRVESATKEGRGILLGRIGEPEDIARCALFLASDDASFISGAHIVADGGAMAAG